MKLPVRKGVPVHADRVSPAPLQSAAAVTSLARRLLSLQNVQRIHGPPQAWYRANLAELSVAIARSDNGLNYSSSVAHDCVCQDFLRV